MNTANRTDAIFHRSFDGCVELLRWSAAKLDPYWPGGCDYVKINVILFCILLPVILASSLALNLILLWVVLGRR